MSKTSVSFFSSNGEEILVKSKDVKKAECQFIPTVKKILVIRLQVVNEDSDVPEHLISGLKTQEAGVGNLYKIESHCPGPKMRNQDEGRRGQPLAIQNREPLPGAENEE